MDQPTFFPAGYSEATRWACRYLAKEGFRIADHPNSEATHLLLPVPSFGADGRIKGGGILEHILTDLPGNVTVIGGHLSHPALAGYQCLDLLLDGEYTARNAAITADCAVRVAGQQMATVFEGCPMLVIGWGRIGKCLAQQLKALGVHVTVAARKEADRNILKALGFGAVDAHGLDGNLGQFRVVFNTVPAMMLSQELAGQCRPDCIKIELASQPGMDGADIVSALGLPGKMAPESSGKLIGQTIIRRLKEVRI